MRELVAGVYSRTVKWAIDLGTPVLNDHKRCPHYICPTQRRDPLFKGAIILLVGLLVGYALGFLDVLGVNNTEGESA